MFDLPTLTAENRSDYREFRNFLLQQGFYMLQFSIYVKIVDNHESAKLTVLRVRNFLPPAGEIRGLVITDYQYQKMLILLGKKLAWEEDFDEPDKTIII